MRVQAPNWLKPRTKGVLIVEIMSSILILLLLLGGILYQVSPLFRQHVFCPLCATTNTAAAPDIYIVNPRDSSAFASDTFLYILGGRTGQVKHTADLGQTGEINYQKVLDGISYQFFSNGIGSAPGTHDILSAIRLSDGKTLWSDTFASQSELAAETSTALYIVSNNTHTTYDLTAISRKDGHSIWVYEPQTNPQIILDNETLFVQEPGGGSSGLYEQIYALRADSGQTVWDHVLNEFDTSSASMVADNGHVFFVSQPARQKATIIEYDEKTGTLLWQKQLNAGDVVASLHVENHYLLIETTDTFVTKHTLYVLRDTDKSVIWSYTLQPSKVLSPNQGKGYHWIYSDDIMYGISVAIDPQTFATNQVMSAWRISDGKELFQTKLDLTGDGYFNVVRIQNQLVFTSRDNSNTVPAHNDVEVRQAQTGALLWHKHFGQIPTQNYPDALELVVSDAQNMQSDYGSGHTPGSLPVNGEPSQAILYLTLYQDTPSVHTLYALDIQSGAILWQVNPDALNIDPQLHGLIHKISLPGATYVVTEFPTPDPTSAPLAITSGPDGNLWFTESLFTGAYEDGIGRITPGGTITEFPLPNSNNDPDGITSGPDGNLWFTEGINYNGGTSNNPSGGKIGRITPGGTITEFPLPNANSSPGGIISGSDGNLWFTESQLASGILQGEIGRITPGGTITEFPLPKNSFPGEITSGPDGNLWFTGSFQNGFTDRHSEIGRITPGGTITEFLLPNANLSLRMITRGPDGNLWFTESVEDGSGNSHGEIGRITPGGKITEFSIPNSNNYSQGGGGVPYGIQLGPAAITSGPDGNLWFTNLSQSGDIERLTPSGTITKFSLPAAYSYGIIRGSDGNLWFTETGANQIGRIVFGK